MWDKVAEEHYKTDTADAYQITIWWASVTVLILVGQVGKKMGTTNVATAREEAARLNLVLGLKPLWSILKIIFPTVKTWVQDP